MSVNIGFNASVEGAQLPKGVGDSVPTPGGPYVAAGSTAYKYNNKPYPSGSDKNIVTDSRKKNAPKADKPTIAAVDPSTKLNAALQQVGGNSSQVMPSLVSILNQLKMMMRHANSSSNSPATSTTSGVNQTLITALENALAQLSNQYGFMNVINILNITFSNDNVDYLETQNNTIVTEAVFSLIMSAVQNGSSNLPHTTTPGVNNIATVTVQPVVTLVPNFYVQQYYTVSTDPYPGYIQWIGPSGDSVFTIRTALSPNYASSQDAVSGQAQTLFVSMLGPYFQQSNLTVTVLNTVLDYVNQTTQTNATNSALGNNSSSNMSSLASQILGIIGMMINKAQSAHIPNSVLNQSSMSNTIQSFTKNMNLLKTMKNMSSSAFQGNSSSGILGGLGSLGSMFSGISSITSGLSSISSALSSANIGSAQGLINNAVSTLGSMSNLSNNNTASSSVSSLTNISNNLTTSNISSSVTALNAVITNLTSLTALTLNSDNSLTLNSYNILAAVGLSSTVIAEINTISVQNPELGVTLITDIASIASALYDAGFADAGILLVLSLASELIQDQN